MEYKVEEELLKIIVESLQSEEGNLDKAVDLAINFSTKNSNSSDQFFGNHSRIVSSLFYQRFSLYHPRAYNIVQYDKIYCMMSFTFALAIDIEVSALP